MIALQRNKKKLLFYESPCKVNEKTSKNRKEAFENHKSNKGSKVDKQHSKLNSKQANNSVRTWSKDMKRQLTKQMANKHWKDVQLLLAMRETQIKTTTKYHDTPIRIAKIKNGDTTKSWGGCSEALLLICGW